MIESLLISLQLALVTTAILLLIALPLAYLLAFKSFRGRTVLEVIVALPLVLPPTVLGYYVLLMIAPDSAVGRIWDSLFDSSLAFSFSGMVFASLIYSLPFAVQPMQQALRAIPKSWLEMAATQGLSLKQTLFQVMLPAARGGVLVAAALSFAHTMGEFGVVLMVGGSIPGETRVASIALFEFVEMQQASEAWMLALILLAVSFVMLSLVYTINRKSLSMVGGR
ncbi:molybdate transport system permease protein [Mariprofundus micogutta]|uniref:Molybdenum transport system permease n=1 Tax=Mariprofundus micogutta TaxID=1921010 RepID=A0A1L8CQD3_9PROT|nr:molybdate ABC transporter permease subunit [Mariprofundus micogutta]GAV21135.1 molybdate transport system permease protein [Mariprofundus micogutta]